MTSPTQWTWVWINSGNWWWTGRPGVLQFMGSKSRTWLSNWTELNKSVYVTCGFIWLVHIKLHLVPREHPTGGTHGQTPWSGHSALQLSPEPPGRPLHIGTSSLHTLFNSQVGGRDRVEKEYHLQSLGYCLSLRVWFCGSNLTLLVSSSSVKQDDIDHSFPPLCCLEGHVKWGNDNTLLTAKYLMVLNITIPWVLKTAFLPTLKSPRWFIWCGYELQGKKLALFWEFPPNLPYSLSKEW